METSAKSKRMSNNKDKVSDSGVELSRKSGSGSFAGVDRSSFLSNDFSDSGQGSVRGSYDDYDDDDDDVGVKVDLNAFMGNVPDGDDVGDAADEEEEASSEEEDEDEEEDEGEYETEEEEMEGQDMGPSDEVATNLTTSSAQRLEEQRVQNKAAIKEKKKELVNEYLQNVKLFNNLRTKNILLGLKIISHTFQRETIVEQYVQRELADQERIREAERLKRLAMLASCAALQRQKKKELKQQKSKEKSSKPRKRKMKARFSTAPVPAKTTTTPTTTATSSSEPELKELMKRRFQLDVEPHQVPDVSLRTLGKEFLYNTKQIEEKRSIFSFDINRLTASKRRKYLRERVGRKLRRFSFHRSLFLDDVKTPTRINRKKVIDFMNLKLAKLRAKSAKILEKGMKSESASVADATVKISSSSQYTRRKISRTGRFPGLTAGRRRIRRVDATEAKSMRKSKSRMGLDHRVQEQMIRLHAESTDYKNLHHFKFEFADPRLTARQASVKYREELVKLLQQRQIPTVQLKWPLEVRGVELEGRNPYGRVTLNYTRLSHREKEAPHTAYRILLTNLAFWRTKEQRLNKEHRKNMAQLEGERVSLRIGITQIVNEIVEGLRIFCSLCGVADHEKKEAKRENENFIQDFIKFTDDFLFQKLEKLYTAIHSCEFALRRLWISEGKGEGAELHEFKDIMRGREKLKMQHKNMEKSIQRYQNHSSTVLKSVQTSGRKLHNAKESVGKMGTQLDRLKNAVDVMIEGMYLCQETVRKEHAMEIQLKSETGILSSPTLTEDYKNLLVKIEDTKITRLDLQRQYNSKVREIEKITVPNSRYVRYKLRS